MDGLAQARHQAEGGLDVTRAPVVAIVLMLQGELGADFDSACNLKPQRGPGIFPAPFACFVTSLQAQFQLSASDARQVKKRCSFALFRIPRHLDSPSIHLLPWESTQACHQFAHFLMEGVHVQGGRQ